MLSGADPDLSGIGQVNGVAACQTLDFLSHADVLAFGFHVDDPGVGLCAALNPCTHTYAFAQEGILPPISIAKIIELEIKAVGFSLGKDLNMTSLNEMWENDGPPKHIEMKGHVAVKGQGTLGFKASNKVKVTITIDLQLLIDADYNNNGIVQAINSGSDVSSNQHASSSLSPIIVCILGC